MMNKSKASRKWVAVFKPTVRHDEVGSFLFNEKHLRTGFESGYVHGVMDALFVAAIVLGSSGAVLIAVALIL